MTTVESTRTALRKVDVDAVVVGVLRSGGRLVAAAGAEPLDAALGGRLVEVLEACGARGEPGEATVLPVTSGMKASTAAVVGLGDVPADGPLPVAVLRDAAGAGARALAGRDSLAVSLPLAGDAAASPVERAGALGEGVLLGAYVYEDFRGTGTPEHVVRRRRPVERVVVLSDDGTTAVRGRVLDQALERGRVLASATALARDLVNCPPGDLPPLRLAEVARERGEAVGLSVDVTDGDDLADGGHGGILGVGKGSANPPCLVRLEHKPRRARSKKTVHLVGKGITFDSGGLSLKPPAAMEWMKTDMGGAAAVLGTLVAAAELDVDVRVVGWLACAENMPSGKAQRPGDVLTTRGGTTVEVLNTDAEGRLVMADALVRAGEEEPDYLLDAATLTGAQLVALGTRVAGVMGDEALRTRVVEAAGRAGEGAWPMPLPVELREQLRSTVADVKNISGTRDAGMLVAGEFLRRFVPDGVPWAHLDIAGPAWNGGSPHGLTPKGGTGAAVRTFVTLLEDVAEHG